MAYIDKSRAIGMLERFREEHSNLPNACLKMIDVALIIIKQIPTTDVMEVKHGKWSYEYSSDVLGGTDATYDWTCSACKEMSVDNTAFCPNCGAKMDLSEKPTGCERRDT